MSYMEKHGVIEEFAIESKAIENNIIGESVFQKNAAYLPASYHDGDRIYPVVYFLHGFSQSYRQIYKMKAVLDRFMHDSGKEFILVSVNGHNRYGGSFWADSPVTGNWMQFFLKEVIPHVDETYRTVPEAESRAVSGFSMGAGAAISLLMMHPDIFQTAYALCPGVLGAGDFRTAVGGWAQSVINAYAAVFSPDVNSEFPHGRFPLWNGSPGDDETVSKLLDAFPGSKKRIADYKKRNIPFRALQIDYAVNDEYSWLVHGVRTLSEIFKEEGIPHVLNALDITHEINSGAVENSMLPFLSASLNF